jgi:hypothetical protein
MTTPAERLAQLAAQLNASGVVPYAQVVAHTHTGAGLTKLSGQAIQITQTTIAHGLAGTPSVVIISPRGVSFVYESAPADGTNVYMTAAGVTTADIYVAL